MKSTGSKRKMKTGFNKLWSALFLFMGLAFIASPANAIGTIIATALALTGTTAVVVATVINIAVSMIIAKNAASGLDGALSGASQNPGNRQTIPPATNNKLPVVYGSAWTGGSIVDMSISTDNQWMHWVIALSEVTGDGSDSYTFGDIYFGGRKCVFSSTDPYKVTGLYDPSTLVTDNAVNGKLYIYLYRNGTNSNVNSPYTAYQIMTGAGAFPIDLTYKWTVQQMSNCAFAIVQMNYSQDANLTTLQQMKFQLNNPRNAPGDCFLDYLTNTTYGAGLNLTDTNGDYTQVDVESLIALNTYCAEPFSYVPSGGGTATQNRFQFNGVIDTNRSIMDNLQEMATSCDCLIKYNEITGLWGVIVQQPTYTVAMDINDSNMIGAITITPTDIANAYNVIECKFPDTSNQDSFNVATFDIAQLAPTLLYPNEPINKQTVTLSMVNNNVTAQYVANRLLEAGREDLNITCTIDYTGLQLEAGDIVTVTNANYGWGMTEVNAGNFEINSVYKIKTVGTTSFTAIGASSNTVDTIFIATGAGTGTGVAYLLKQFRITKVTEQFGSDGTITAALILSEFNPQVYDDKDITQFTPAPNTGLPNALSFGTLNPPIITNETISVPAPFFYVYVPIPTNGIAQYAEIYYSVSNDGSNLIFAGTTEVKPSGNSYAPPGDMPPVVLTGIAAGDWYFFYKIVNGLGTSGLSAASDLLHWRPNTYQYANRYLIIAYASSDDGTYNFSFNKSNQSYFGIYSSDIIETSSNPADYTWFEASPNFTNANYLLYALWGNRSVSYAVSTADYFSGSGNFVSTDINYPNTVWSGLPNAISKYTNFQADLYSSDLYSVYSIDYLGSESNMIGKTIAGDYIQPGTYVTAVDPYDTFGYRLYLNQPMVGLTTDVFNTTVQYGTVTQPYIDLDQTSGQAIITGLTTANANNGMLAIQPTNDGRLQVALNKFISFGTDGSGAEILHKTVQPSLLTIDIFGRVVGFQYPDDFYFTIQNYTTTSGQTVFTTTRSSTYLINNCLVFENGTLVDVSEYTDTAGSTGTVTFSSGRSLNNSITIISIRASHTASAGSFVLTKFYTITDLGSTTNAQWNTIAGTSGVTYSVGSTFTCANIGTGFGTGQAATVYNAFTRFNQTITNENHITPTTPIENGFEYLFFNGIAMTDPDYNINNAGDIIDLPANMSGTMTVIQWAANNLSAPAGNCYQVTTYTQANQPNYNFGLTQYAFNLHYNGVFQVNGTTTTTTTNYDYTTVSGGYALSNTPLVNTDTLLQQSFTRTGAA